MGRTKNVGSIGRYGARYGAAPRKKALLIEKRMKALHRCPRCRTPGALKRISIGIWTCKKCGYKFTGGAWIPRTMLGKTFAPEELKKMGLK